MGPAERAGAPVAPGYMAAPHTEQHLPWVGGGMGLGSWDRNLDRLPCTGCHHESILMYVQSVLPVCA